MLNIVVCLKQVPDRLSVEIEPLSGAINTERLVYITNPADAGALELALRWREKAGGGQVHAVTFGPERADKILREALALGVDSVIRIWSKTAPENSPRTTAQALAATIKTLKPDLLLCGARSADRASGLVPGYLAEFLDLASATGVSAADFDPLKNELQVERKLERGKRQRLVLALPALLAMETGIAELRYASFPKLLAAQRATIPVVEFYTEKEMQTSGLRLVEITSPRPRPRQIFIPDPNLPAAARIEAILSGGAAIKQKKGGPIEGSAQEQAERILDFLEQNGFLD